MKRLLFYLSCFFLITSCTIETKVNDFRAKDINLIVKNPQKKYISELFDSLTYIKLSNYTNTSLIKEISKIEISDNKIFILDRPGNKLCLYDKAGTFEKIIGSIGQGPGEYIKVVDFAIDHYNREILILDSQAGKVNVYDLDGSYIRNMKLDFMARQIIATKDFYVYYTSGSDFYVNSKESEQCWDEKMGYNLFITDKKSVIKKRFFYYNINVDDLLCENVLDYNVNDDTFMFHYSLYDTIYQFSSKDTLRYIVDFGQNKIPASDIKKEDFQYYINKTGFARVVNAIHSSNYIFVNYVLNNRVNFFLKNKNETNITNVSYLENDIDKTSFSLSYPHKIDGDDVYFSKNAEDLIFDYKCDSVYLNSFLVTEDSNPIIIVGHLK